MKCLVRSDGRDYEVLDNNRLMVRVSGETGGIQVIAEHFDGHGDRLVIYSLLERDGKIVHQNIGVVFNGIHHVLINRS
jgi:hypothetical protein